MYGKLKSYEIHRTFINRIKHHLSVSNKWYIIIVYTEIRIGPKWQTVLDLGCSLFVNTVKLLAKSVFDW